MDASDFDKNKDVLEKFILNDSQNNDPEEGVIYADSDEMAENIAFSIVRNSISIAEDMFWENSDLTGRELAENVLQNYDFNGDGLPDDWWEDDCPIFKLTDDIVNKLQDEHIFDDDGY